MSSGEADAIKFYSHSTETEVFSTYTIPPNDRDVIVKALKLFRGIAYPAEARDIVRILRYMDKDNTSSWMNPND